MATYVCTACGNLHGAPVAHCGTCGAPSPMLVPDGVVPGPLNEPGKPRALSDFEERQEARERRHEERDARLTEANEKRAKANEERLDRLVSAGVKVLDSIQKLIDRTPTLPGSPPLVAPHKS